MTTQKMKYTTNELKQGQKLYIHQRILTITTMEPPTPLIRLTLKGANPTHSRQVPLGTIKRITHAHTETIHISETVSTMSLWKKYIRKSH